MFKKKQNLTLAQQLKNFKLWLKITSTIIILLIGIITFIIYSNYNYIAFKYLISSHYIYTETLDTLYQKELKMNVNGKYSSYFDDIAISAVTQKIREINKDKYTYLFIPEQLEKYKQEEKDEAALSAIRVLNEKTIYMKLPNFSKYTAEFMENNLAQLKKYPNVIIDLRYNLGGDTVSLYKMAGYFLPKGTVMAVDNLRLFNWTYKSKKSQALPFEKIVLLQNKSSASSSENFIAALKDNLDNVSLIGETTFGKGIGQYTLPLKNGFAVKATVMKWNTPKGKNIQGEGIVPDITYLKDDIIQFAVNKLAK